MFRIKAGWLSRITIIILTVVGVTFLIIPVFAALGGSGEYTVIDTGSSRPARAKDEEVWVRERERASAYNAYLIGQAVLLPPHTEEGRSAIPDDYETIMNMDGKGRMGVIRIPEIEVELPIYHGSTDRSLKKGAGHLEGTSFPIGGVSTHTVISAHSGDPAASFFDKLHLLALEDVFYIESLGDVLAYRVDQIKVVEAYDTSELEIVPDGDYATLLTCTPYGVNTHRLLVRGVRIRELSVDN